MKRLLLLFVILQSIVIYGSSIPSDSITVNSACSSSQSEQNCGEIRHKPTRPKEKTEGLDDTTKEVLAHFAGVVGNFFTLLQDTNNVEHVGNCLNGMINGMINIGVTAMKKSPFPTQKYSEQEIDSIVKKMVAYLQELLLKIMQERILLG